MVDINKFETNEKSQKKNHNMKNSRTFPIHGRPIHGPFHNNVLTSFFIRRVRRTIKPFNRKQNSLQQLFTENDQKAGGTVRSKTPPISPLNLPISPTLNRRNYNSESTSSVSNSSKSNSYRVVFLKCRF